MRTDVESFDDFCQYYTGRFVKDRNSADTIYRVVGKASDTLCLFERYNHGRKSSDTVQWSWPQVQDCVLFGLPRLGAVVYKNELLYLYYRADRNGGRGYDPRRIDMVSFNSWLLRKSSHAVVNMDTLDSPPFAYLATRNIHTTWNEAVSDLLGDKPIKAAYALSYNFGAFLGENVKPSLTYKNDVVGHIEDRDTAVLTPAFSRYEDILRRTLNCGVRHE